MTAQAQVQPGLHVATKAEAVYQELRSRILDGSIKPASTLNQEALAATLGLSITPLREALRRLESEGLVRLQHASPVLHSRRFHETALLEER